MSQAEVNNELMVLSNFYGTIAATQNLDSKILEKCNSQLMRCLEQLDKATNHLVSLSSGIII